jgi:hypothetical protein
LALSLSDAPRCAVSLRSAPLARFSARLCTSTSLKRRAALALTLSAPSQSSPWAPPPLQVARPAQVALRVAVVSAQAQAQLVAGLGNGLAQDDVDGAGDGARTGLGGGGAQDLDALDLIGRQLGQRRSRPAPRPRRR